MLFIENLRTNLKFNHIYVSSTKHTPTGSDIHEEVSILGTDRTSELTTEHCSDTKNCHSAKNQPVSGKHSL